MALSPKLPAHRAFANMADFKPPYTKQEAIIEADRCLFCFDAPCIMACPTGIDIPSFIKKIATDNPTAAARTILSANVLGASCARVCPTEVLCEGACVVLAREGNPVKIGRLQRYATDYVSHHKITVLKAPATNQSGRRIAVIGGGPAGLGCAAELAQLGHKAVIFEKQALPGGLNTYGVAYYKMRPQVSLEEIEMIKSIGVEIQCGVEVGRDISSEILVEEYDAIFLGVGLGKGPPLGIPGENLPEVMDALDFIAQIHTSPLHEIPIGDRVAIIGCGNTAMDTITQAKRLGAEKATIIYWHGPEEMPAYGFEYDLAKNDGGTFLFHSVVEEVIPDAAGHVAALRLTKTRLDAKGKWETVPGSEFTEPCDMVLKAIGSEKQTSLLKGLFPSLKIDSDGVIEHDTKTGQTNLPYFFCGGDCANGGREVVNAVAEGKKGARGIHAYLTGTPLSGPVQPSRYGVTGSPLGSGFDNPIRVTELE